MSLERVIKEAIKEVVPDKELVEKARKAEKIIRDRLEKVLREYENIEYRFLGSYARNTWIAESLEIDIFLMFPENTSFNELEKTGIEIGKRIVDAYELKFASHPYVHGVVEGVEVDVVPCYKLKTAERIKSAVDRTPFHHDWLKERIKGKEDQVRLLKKFLKVANLYGAEYRIRGFSGYLCELLIIFYGSFENLVKNGAFWRRNMVIDVEKREIRVEKGLRNIFVIDPVDRKRNVAANLSLDNLARFIHVCRMFIQNPSLEFFREREGNVDEKKLIDELKNRFVHAVVFEKPKIVEDNLYSQLEKAEKRLKKLLEENDFEVLRTSHFAGEKCYILIETSADTLSGVKKHIGPPVESYKNGMRFIEKNKIYAIFFEDGRYTTYRRRNFRDVRDVIEYSIRNHYPSMGKDISEFIKNGEVLSGLHILGIREIRNHLGKFLGVI